MKLKWIVPAVAGVAFVAGWAAVGAGVLMGVDRGAGIALVTAAALATEALFWAGAFALGVSVFEARRRIWRVVSRPFRRAGDQA